MLRAAPELKEVTVVKDFVSEEEERCIVAEIDGSRWAESQSGRRKQVSLCGIINTAEPQFTGSSILSVVCYQLDKTFQHVSSFVCRGLS